MGRILHAAWPPSIYLEWLLWGLYRFLWSDSYTSEAGLCLLFSVGLATWLEVICRPFTMPAYWDRNSQIVYVHLDSSIWIFRLYLCNCFPSWIINSTYCAHHLCIAATLTLPAWQTANWTGKFRAICCIYILLTVILFLVGSVQVGDTQWGEIKHLHSKRMTLRIHPTLGIASVRYSLLSFYYVLLNTCITIPITIYKQLQISK